MKDHAYYINKAEQYASNLLSEEERWNIEAEAEIDEMLAKEIDLQLGIETLIRAGRRIEIERKVQKIADNYSPNNKKQTIQIPFLKSMVVAAAIVLLLLLINFSRFNSPTHQRLFAKHIHAYSNVFVPLPQKRGERSKTPGGQSALTPLQSAMQLYSNEEYGKAIEGLELITADNTLYDFAQFYLGISYLMNEEPHQAILTFRLSNNQRLSGLIQWYLGMAYLKIDQPEQAVTHFRAVILDETVGTSLKKDAGVIIEALK